MVIQQLLREPVNYTRIELKCDIFLLVVNVM